MPQIKLAPDELINSSEINSVRFWEKGTTEGCPNVDGEVIPQDEDRLCILMSDGSHRQAEGTEAWRIRDELRRAGVAITLFASGAQSKTAG
jgi:hypothetical protein